jgi:ribosomal protein S18 acetylase RimI-like enzyme
MGVGEACILSGRSLRQLTFLTRVQECKLPLRLGAGDVRPALAVLAEAFADAPLTRCVVGGSRPRRLRSTRLGLRAQLPAALARATVLGEAGGSGLAGALVGAPPYGHPFPAPPLARRLFTTLGQGLAVADGWAELFERLLARRPAPPHWYLALLGVAPREQRRGVGSRLLRTWLSEVDAARGPAWLETDEPRSLGLYRAAGFEIADEIAFRSVPIWLLARAPRRG